MASTIVSRTLQHDTATANQLIDRLRIVFASPDFYADSAEVECLLHRILLTELKPYGTERFALSGEPLQMSQRQARNLALVVHELATNSAKYGGLSVGDGFLVVTWRMQSDEIVIDWKEQGRNSGAAPGNLKGFGTRLIETMVRDLKGRIERFASEFRLRVPHPSPDRSQCVARRKVSRRSNSKSKIQSCGPTGTPDGENIRHCLCGTATTDTRKSEASFDELSVREAQVIDVRVIGERPRVLQRIVHNALERGRAHARRRDEAGEFLRRHEAVPLMRSAR